MNVDFIDEPNLVPLGIANICVVTFVPADGYPLIVAYYHYRIVFVIFILRFVPCLCKIQSFLLIY